MVVQGLLLPPQGAGTETRRAIDEPLQKLILSLSKPIRSSVIPRAPSGLRSSGSTEMLQPVPHFLQKGTEAIGKRVVPDTYPCLCAIHAQTSLLCTQLSAFKPITHNATIDTSTCYSFPFFILFCACTTLLLANHFSPDIYPV